MGLNGVAAVLDINIYLDKISNSVNFMSSVSLSIRSLALETITRHEGWESLLEILDTHEKWTNNHHISLDWTEKKITELYKNRDHRSRKFDPVGAPHLGIHTHTHTHIKFKKVI